MSSPSLIQFEAALDTIRESPGNEGCVEMIVCRPEINERLVLEEAILDCDEGLREDRWKKRGSRADSPGSPHLERQLTLMNARAIAVIAGDRENWALSGDQFFVDLDLSPENLPPRTRLRIGAAIIEVSAQPHTGCRKFARRFGEDALRFVNSEIGRNLNLRGIHAKVVESGCVGVGDRIVVTHRQRRSVLP